MNTYEYRGIRSLSISCARFVWVYITDKVVFTGRSILYIWYHYGKTAKIPWYLAVGKRCLHQKLCEWLKDGHRNAMANLPESKGVPQDLSGFEIADSKDDSADSLKKNQGYFWKLCIILEYRHEDEDGTVHPFQVMLPSWKLHWRRKNQLVRLLMLCQLAIPQFGETNVPTPKIGGPLCKHNPSHPWITGKLENCSIPV